ncbi:hypothetical protein FD755_004434 [Muntiacus reevesi]|uniref:Linker for activation of T-cells family member 2 n=1 Tax=Muntiacus reevesi TaxID=9886 RepID=A0A5J5MRP1_MUNRE|nr:hypothetical protein FD755_004434 [Muntiacus reevesi]
MSADTELLWPGAALLLLLGAAAGLCVRCSRPGAKKSEKIYEQRSLSPFWPMEETEKAFIIMMPSNHLILCLPLLLLPLIFPSIRGFSSESTLCIRWPEKDKMLRFSPSLEDSSSPRYQYFSKGSRPRSEEAYIDPTSTDYYNYDPFQKPAEDDDDTNSYENVLICKPKRMESGDEGSEDYQNSASIQQWRESKKVVESALREAPLTLTGSPDEDGEPDYVNGDVAATEA